MFQTQLLRQPACFRFAIGFNPDPAIGSTYHPTDGYDNNVDQFMLTSSFYTRIGQVFKAVANTIF